MSTGQRLYTEYLDSERISFERRDSQEERSCCALLSRARTEDLPLLATLAVRVQYESSTNLYFCIYAGQL